MFEYTVAPSVSTRFFTPLNNMNQGSDYTNRIGRQVTIKSWHLRLNVYSPIIDAPDVSPMSRVVVFIDTQANNVDHTLMLWTTPFQPSGAIGTASGTTFPMNLENRDRFKMLYDKVRPLNLMSGLDNNYVTYSINKYRKCNFVTTYSAAITGSQTVTNALVVGFASDAANVNGAPVVRGVIRVRFTDA